MSNTTTGYDGRCYRFDPETHLLLRPKNSVNQSTEMNPCQPEISGLWQFLLELRQRKVCRAALIYALAIWLVFQVADVVFGALNFPDWALPMVVVAGILGFPIALILAWTFEVTPSGLKLDIPVASKGTPQTSPRDVGWNFALLVASGIISVQLLLYGFGGISPTKDESARLRNAESIVVTPFQATSVSLESKAYAFAISEEIRHLLNVEYDLSVISVDSWTTLLQEQRKADLLLQGSVTIARDEVLVMVHLVDPANGYDIWSDMIRVPDYGDPSSQHRAVRQMLRALPIGNVEEREESNTVFARLK